MKPWMLAMCLFVCCGTASGNDPAEAVVKFKANARVFIDAHGVPQRVEPSMKLAEPIRALVEQQVLRWRFKAPVVAGEARAGTTHVGLIGCAIPRLDGAFDVAMKYQNNGPGFHDEKYGADNPPYPVDAARNGDEGHFNVIMKIDGTGRASVESIESVKGRVGPFRESIRKWVASKRYVPEEVDGVPIPARISTTVEFTLPTPEEMALEQAKQADPPRTCDEIFEDRFEHRPFIDAPSFTPLSTD